MKNLFRRSAFLIWTILPLTAAGVLPRSAHSEGRAPSAQELKAVEEIYRGFGSAAQAVVLCDQDPGEILKAFLDIDEMFLYTQEQRSDLNSSMADGAQSYKENKVLFYTNRQEYCARNKLLMERMLETFRLIKTK